MTISSFTTFLIENKVHMYILWNQFLRLGIIIAKIKSYQVQGVFTQFRTKCIIYLYTSLSCNSDLNLLFVSRLLFQKKKTIAKYLYVVEKDYVGEKSNSWQHW